MSTEISVTFRRVSRWNCRDGTVRMLASLFGVWMTSWLVMPRPSPTVVRVYCNSCSNRPPSTTQKQGQCESGFQLIDHCVSVHYVHVPFIHYISINISTNYWRLYNLIDWLLFNTISAVIFKGDTRYSNSKSYSSLCIVLFLYISFAFINYICYMCMPISTLLW